MSVPHSILILGPGKSGTTALFEAVRAAAEKHHGSPCPTVFEPRSVETLLAAAKPRGIVKMLQGRLPLADAHNIAAFEKRVYIYRDPRDNIVSLLVWRFWSALDADDLAGRKMVLDALRAKEAAPAKISLRSLFTAIAEASGKIIEANALLNSIGPREMLRADLGLYPLRYEDFIDGNLDGLSDYLGFPVVPVTMPAKRAHLRRSATSGDWKHWFTPADIEFFVTPYRAAYLELDYDPDEALAARQTIDPAFASGFVQGQFDRLDANQA